MDRLFRNRITIVAALAVLIGVVFSFRLFLVQLRPTEEVKREKVAKETTTAGSQEKTVKQQPVRNSGKVGPNDPCPCGSGKKYKKCCRDKDIAAGMEQ